MASLESDYNYFLKADTSQYKGKWLAISEGKIIAVGKDIKKVTEIANKKIGSNKFLLVRVPAEDTMIF